MYRSRVIYKQFTYLLVFSYRDHIDITEKGTHVNVNRVVRPTVTYLPVFFVECGSTSQQGSQLPTTPGRSPSYRVS